MTGNLRIWNAVEKTDPKHTKPVSFGARKFTSIDAHYQILRMTEQFGPVGEGWGYEAKHSIEHMGDVHLAVCDVTIWWLGEHLTPPSQMPASKPRNHYGPIRGTAELYTVGKRLDDDAPKKCLTDALTKGLSHLGLSADVFLGLFDDNKYVQKMAKEFASPMSQDPDVTAGSERWVSEQKTLLINANTTEEVKGWYKTNEKAVKKLFKDNEPLWQSIKDAYDDALDRVRAPV